VDELYRDNSTSLLVGDRLPGPHAACRSVVFDLALSPEDFVRHSRFFILVSLAAFACIHGHAHAVTISGQFSVVDTNAPSSFSVLYSLPTAPLTGTFQSVMELSGLLIDGRQDGVSATPFGTAAIAQFLINGVSFFDLGPTATTAGIYGPYTASAVINAADFGGTIHTLGLRLGFTGSGRNDQYTFTATNTLEPVIAVHAPATLMLFALGLVGLGWFRRGTARRTMSP
jgi:hypothetical protein